MYYAPVVKLSILYWKVLSLPVYFMKIFQNFYRIFYPVMSYKHEGPGK